MRVLTLVLGGVGLAIALAGVWSHFPTWLNLLGIFVPSIGAVLIVDQLITRRATSRSTATFRVQPFAAWLIGAARGYAVHHWAPHFSEAVVGMVAAAVAYLIIDRVTPERAPRLAGATPTETEAVS